VEQAERKTTKLSAIHPVFLIYIPRRIRKPPETETRRVGDTGNRISSPRRRVFASPRPDGISDHSSPPGHGLALEIVTTIVVPPTEAAFLKAARRV
jgi:hypothetical protein